MKWPFTIAIDISPSIGRDLLSSLKPGIELLISTIFSIPMRNKVSIVSLGDEIITRCSFTNNERKIKRAIRNLEVGGGGPLLEQILVCVRRIKQHCQQTPILRDAILIVATDGVLFPSEFTQKENIITQIKKEKIPIWIIGLSGSCGTEEKLLDDLAYKTGGLYYSIPPDPSLEEVLDIVCLLQEDLGFRPKPKAFDREIENLREAKEKAKETYVKILQAGKNEIPAYVEERLSIVTDLKESSVVFNRACEISSTLLYHTVAFVLFVPDREQKKFVAARATGLSRDHVKTASIQYENEELKQIIEGTRSKYRPVSATKIFPDIEPAYRNGYCFMLPIFDTDGIGGIGCIVTPWESLLPSEVTILERLLNIYSSNMSKYVKKRVVRKSTEDVLVCF